MKKLIAILLLLGLAGSSAFGITATKVGKTTLGINYLVWGTYVSMTTTDGTIATGLTTIRAWGINGKTTAEAIASSVSGGTITAKCATSTYETGSYWAIGR